MLYQALTKVRAGGGKETVKSIPVCSIESKTAGIESSSLSSSSSDSPSFLYDYEYEMEKTRFRTVRPKPDYGGHSEIGSVLAGGASVPASRTIRLTISLRQNVAADA